MELWVIAAIIDAHAEPSADMRDDPTGEGVVMTEGDFQRQSMALIAQRIAAAEANAAAGNGVGSSPSETQAPIIP